MSGFTPSNFSFSDGLSSFDFYNKPRIQLASASLSGQSSASFSLMKIATSSSSLTGSGSMSPSPIEILLPSASMISDSSFTLSAPITITPISASVSGTSSLSGGYAIRFSPSITEDTQRLKRLILIDNISITEHGRKLDLNVLQSNIENTNWNSRRSRYYKVNGARNSFTIEWTMVPSLKSQTVDERYGRDKINQISRDPDVHTLKILNLDTDGLTPYSESEYTVIVKSYNETLMRRDINNNMYLWDCSLELEEV